VSARFQVGVALLAIAGLTVGGGCGGGSESPGTTASIPGGAATHSGAEGGPSGPAQDPLHPIVRMETSAGAVTLRLDGENARLTVDNFLSYVEKRHYDGTIFHQIFPAQGIIGGGYTPDLEEKLPLAPPVRNEAHNGLRNRRGTIAMLRAPDEIDSARSQFFLNLADNQSLDHRDRTVEGYGYSVFGEVIEGAEVLDRIGRTPVSSNGKFDHAPVETVLIQSVRRLR
jgi:cyclophilin family peptidyl-prolyl cis-trans isomerase